MCTLVCWIGTHPAAPLVIAANRDERLGRASSGPVVWPGSPRVVSPRDEVAGGSWWAVNEHRLFVGLTNRAGANLDAHRRSRGQLVMDVARCATLDEAERLLRSLRAEDYNGFHLLAADTSGAVLGVDTGDALTVSRLGKGRHIVSERSFEAAPLSRDATVAQVLEGAPPLLRLETSLATHVDDPFRSVCVHLPELDYGTRSSTILALGGPAAVLRLAPGPPCVTPWTDMSPLLAQIGL